jgi:hypothetical protein
VSCCAGRALTVPVQEAGVGVAACQRGVLSLLALLSSQAMWKVEAAGQTALWLLGHPPVRSIITGHSTKSYAYIGLIEDQICPGLGIGRAIAAGVLSRRLRQM